MLSEAWIAVADASGNVYGSVLWTLGETTSIVAWGEEYEESFGFEVSEPLNWIVSSNDGDIFGTATYSFGVGGI